mmetsp:Transcript_38136/g.64081  ORF Transcript_38136/g.64081 Transcript_38136/m.64081 type:complete len:205 (+) Transcript_38136:1207-1821(+)
MLSLLQLRELKMNSVKPKVHFFNTFFYNDLYSGKKVYDFRKVSRWDRKMKYNFLDCDMLVVPIHLERHWALAVIHIKEARLEYLDSMGIVQKLAGGGDGDGILANLERYIFDLHNHKGVPIPAGWTTAGTPHSVVPKVCRLDIPQQDNGEDCGFLCSPSPTFRASAAGSSSTRRTCPSFGDASSHRSCEERPSNCPVGKQRVLA